jgi:hypothetical protein
MSTYSTVVVLARDGTVRVLASAEWRENRGRSGFDADLAFLSEREATALSTMTEVNPRRAAEWAQEELERSRGGWSPLTLSAEALRSPCDDDRICPHCGSMDDQGIGQNWNCPAGDEHMSPDPATWSPLSLVGIETLTAEELSSVWAALEAEKSRVMKAEHREVLGRMRNALAGGPEAGGDVSENEVEVCIAALDVALAEARGDTPPAPGLPPWETPHQMAVDNYGGSSRADMLRSAFIDGAEADARTLAHIEHLLAAGPCDTRGAMLALRKRLRGAS